MLYSSYRIYIVFDFNISNIYMHFLLGLDPAGPGYEDYDIMAGINPTSGDFVDIIHTDGKSLIIAYGQMRPLGHMDFYPNSGGTQPGCITYIGIVLCGKTKLVKIAQWLAERRGFKPQSTIDN